MKKSKAKYIASSILVGSVLFTTGCNSENNNQEETTTKQQRFKNDVDFKEDKNVVYAKVTAINNNQITVTTGTLNKTDKGKRPESGERPEIPNGEEPKTPQNGERPEIPEGEELKAPQNGERPKMPNGEERLNGGKGMENMINFSGEETIITITDDIKITKMQMRNPNSKEDSSNEIEFLNVSDILIDSIIRIRYNEDKTVVESIELMSSQQNKEEENN